MWILFLDDSYQKFNCRKYLGYGGFCLKADRIKNLTQGIATLKRQYGIPDIVDLKWSPEPNHLLRTTFQGRRHQLYSGAISLLQENNASIICAVHHLDSCYGIRLHGWDFNRTRLWATKQQCKFIAERFESVRLAKDNEPGLIVADHYSDVEGEKSLIQEVGKDFQNGTGYSNFKNLCIPPLTASPLYCTPIQLADIIVGIIVASIIGNRHGLDLFEDVAKMFVLDPHDAALSFASTFSDGALGWGLKLFPSEFAKTGQTLFANLDQRYIYKSESGLSLKG
ncbi:MAG: DUF3800 domain-containing protein [Dehalococcoidales bacterium]|nr:DUF3800 domain-containing protein [Dehalococcoidales bacterium]